MKNLLIDPLIRVGKAEGLLSRLSLPQLYETLAADAVAFFPALRPHQKHPWHAFLCQLGALACIKSGLRAPPRNTADWLAALRALTPDYPEDEPWHLVGAADKPALLQPPQSKLDGFKRLGGPDELDMLVTSKNHDVKAARMASAAEDDWLFALVTLQTMEGFLGAGNYGVSRMNGGFANRPGFSVAPPGGVGAHVMRDIRRLITIRDEHLEHYDDFDEDGLALVWLDPWDGTTSLSPRKLDPYYIEICRRIRLAEKDGRMSALAAGSKVARISFAKGTNGLTGDPWTPVESKDEAPKALTIDARHFLYKRLSDILFEKDFKQAPLQKIWPDDRADCEYVLICRALARGQGKTEGWDERRVVIPPKAEKCFRSPERDLLGNLSQARIDGAGKVRSALRYALMMLFQNGPDRSDYKPRDPASSHRAEPFLNAFDGSPESEVNRYFFERLFAEFEADTEAEKMQQRTQWLLDLRHFAFDILKSAEAGSPQSTLRRYRAFVRAEQSFRESFYSKKNFGDFFRKDEPMQPEHETESLTPAPQSRASPAPDRGAARGLAQAFAEQIFHLRLAERRGDLAGLRRLDPDHPDAPAFFRIVAKIAPEADDAALLRYARLLQILALKPEALANGSFGEALEMAKVSESRVQKLLSARGPAFAEQARLIARRLANAGALPYRELGALLVMSDEDSKQAERIRLHIARDFWLARDRAEYASSETLSSTKA